MTVCFFFDRINYMNSKKRHGRFNTFYGRFMTVRPFFLGKSCIVDSDKGESQNKHTKEGRIKKKKC